MGKLTYQDSDGIRRTLYWDDSAPGVFTVDTEQNLGRLLEENAAMEEAQRYSTNKLIARVPVGIAELAQIQGWDESDWARFLNDPAFRALRVWKGRV